MTNLLRYLYPNKSCFVYSDAIVPQWSSREFATLAEEGFRKNVFAFRSINLIAKGIASIPISVQAENKSEDTELTHLINNPNISMSKSTFFENIISYLLISGNAYIRINENNQLQPLRPDRIQIIPNKKHTGVDHYIYSIDNTRYFITKNELLHLKLFNPLNDWYGISPLQIAAQAIDQYNEMSNHNLAILQNGGRPSGCFVVKEGHELTEEQMQQLRGDIKKNYVGSKHAGKILLLQGGIEWKEMGLSPKDLDFEAGRNLSIREIVEAFGIPPALLGIECDASFKSYKEARLAFWEDTVLPLADFIREEFSAWLSNCFQRKVALKFNLDAIHALVERRSILWDKIANADFLTTNEKREILGYPKLQELEQKENFKQEGI